MKWKLIHFNVAMLVVVLLLVALILSLREKPNVVLTGMSVSMGLGDMTLSDTPGYVVEKIIVTTPNGERVEMKNGEWKHIEVYLK